MAGKASKQAAKPPRTITRTSDTPLRYGASIAVFKGNAILLVKRARAPWRGLWSLPGGRLKAGEHPSEAALRELEEEAGITAEVEGHLDTVEIAAEGDGGGPLTYRLDVFFGRYGAGALRARSDAAEARWVAVGDLENLGLTEGTAALIRRAAERLGLPRA
jgi:8-oxo-dGTP diphosphatase